MALSATTCSRTITLQLAGQQQLLQRCLCENPKGARRETEGSHSGDAGGAAGPAGADAGRHSAG